MLYLICLKCKVIVSQRGLCASLSWFWISCQASYCSLSIRKQISRDVELFLYLILKMNLDFKVCSAHVILAFVTAHMVMYVF